MRGRGELAWLLPGRSTYTGPAKIIDVLTYGLIVMRPDGTRWIWLNEDIDPESAEDKTERWHDGDAMGVPLHTYLGMSWETYSIWML